MYKFFLAVMFVFATFFGVKNIFNLIFTTPVLVAQHGAGVGIAYAGLCVVGLAACSISLYFNIKAKEWRAWGNEDDSK
jgi:hypothetical protein